MSGALAMVRVAVIPGVHELGRFVRLVAIISVLAIVAYALGESAESWPIFSVLKDQSVGQSFKTADGRLCFPWHFEKTRDAVPEAASGRLFIGESIDPVLMGLQHYDGRPLGAGLNSLAPINEPFGTVLCTRPTPEAWTASRLGLQVVMTYRWVPWWTSTVYSPWVDWQNPDR